MKINRLLLLAFCGLLISSCVSKKRYNTIWNDYSKLDGAFKDLQILSDGYQDSLRFYKDLSASLKTQMSMQKSTNDVLLDQLKELSVISGAQAESIKKSLDNIMGKDAYIKNLQSAMTKKDSLNLVLVMNLKGAIGDLDDKDIDIKIEKGVIYINISDKLLFKTGRYEVTEKAKEVLGKIAKVLINHPEIEFMVEGHTDNVPYRDGVLLDNWDLSVKRATSIVRILQEQYQVSPTKMVAAGRGEYIPVASNDDANGRALNRRTRIVILPQLDQFFKLLESEPTK
ncbi:OmpA family protein [Pelobium sp.]|nr:OmpA family protein [Pelobium sp.]MDA9555543.1 OmpA family protein [Pelobium sp.]